MGKPRVPLDELAVWHAEFHLSFTMIAKLINGSKPGRNFSAAGLAQAARKARKRGDKRFPDRPRANGYTYYGPQLPKARH